MLTVTLGGADRRREQRLDIQVLPHRIDRQHSGGVWLGKPWPSQSQKEAAWPQTTTPARAPSMSTTAQWSLWVATWEPVFWSRAPGRTCTGKTLSAKSMTTEPTRSSGECFLIVTATAFSQNKSSFFRSCNRLHNEFQGHLNTNTWSPNTVKLFEISVLYCTM